MLPPLLERESSMAALARAFAQAQAGTGQVVLLSGEAGIGKSSVISHFAAQLRRERTARVFWGGCDALSTPRPLGPLYDIAAQCGGALAALLQQPRPTLSAVLGALLAALAAPEGRGAAPSLLIIEDLHWADHATLDLVHLLGRRVMHLPALVVLSFRDGAAFNGSALQRALADFPATTTTHLPLEPLSLRAVTTLAAQDPRPPEHLMRLTQGNPFFLSEVLERPDGAVPITVRDAVMARVHQLPADARRICEVVSVEPGQAPRAVVDAVFAAEPGHGLDDALDACIVAGILQQVDSDLRFRHELARLAVLDHLPPQRRRNLHAKVLDHLQDLPDTSKARLVHHADGAGLVPMVLELAPQAAADATPLGAHREALAHYVSALRYLEQASTEQQALLLEGWARSAAISAWSSAEVVTAMEKAVALWKSLGQRHRAASTLQEMAFMWQGLWQADAAERCLDEAMALLEPDAPPLQLAALFNQRAFFCMRKSATAETLAWSGRARDVMRDAGVSAVSGLSDVAVAIDTRVAAGTALMRAGFDEGERMLRACLPDTFAAGLPLPMIACYTYLSESTLRQCRFAEAEAWSREALTRLQDAGDIQHYYLGVQAQLLVSRGEYAQAITRAREVLDALTTEPGVMQWGMLLAEGVARCRSGAEGGVERLRQCYGISQGPYPYYVLPAASALVEGLVLQGDEDAARAVLHEAWSRRGDESSPWLVRPLQVWARRLGTTLDSADDPSVALENAGYGRAADAEPLVLELAGDAAGAAAFWARVGAPYEQARCLMACGSEGVQQAIAIWTRIGAAAAERQARAEARRQGLRGVRRGPYQSARSNALGLSAREQQILQLLAQGHSNAAIAQQLSRSERTVEHHVSRMLSKTGVAHRAALVAQARKMGALDLDGEATA